MSAGGAPDLLPRGTAMACMVCALALAAACVWMLLGFTGLGGPGLAGLNFVPFGAKMLFAVVCALSGAFTLAHPAGASVGRLLLLTSSVQLVAHAMSAVAAAIGVGAATRTVVVLCGLAGEILFAYLQFALPLWLPDGRLPGRRWGRALAVALAAWTAAQIFYDTALRETWYGMPNPLARPPWTAVADVIVPALRVPIEIVPPCITLMTWTVMALRWRRRSRGTRALPPLKGRQALLLLLPYLLSPATSHASYYLGAYFTLPGNLFLLLYYLPLVTWSLAVGVIFVRDRSGFLDRSARRGLALLVLLTGLVVGYALVAVILFRSLPGTPAPGALILTATGLLTGLFVRSAARGAVQAVDRFYYGDRARPYQVVRGLASRLSRTVNPADTPRLLCDTVVGTLRLPAARVVIETSAGPREAVRVGAATDASWCAFPLSYEGRGIGSLEVVGRTGRAALDRQDHEVLRLLADQASPAIGYLQLYEDLQASRERLVFAREAARRQLRCDLHDGLAPSLSGLRLQIDTARAALAPTHPAAHTLTRISHNLAEAITELRRITNGLSPAAVDRTGLTGALHQLATQLSSPRLTITTDLSPDPLPPLPAAIEVAVYRIASEALHNAVRHSGAAQARLTVRTAGDTVTTEISDDGTGLAAQAPHTPGMGLRSMTQRAEELGGTLTLTTGPENTGLLVRATLPHDAR